MSAHATRRLYQVALRPVQGSRFQPTGFPDIGPAEYERPDENGDLHPMLLVESAQSMANRLESVGWDEGAQSPVSTLDGLPFVRVVAGDDEARYLTSSRTEAHRLASAFVRHSRLDGQPMTEVIRERIGMRDDTPLPLPQVAAAVMALDPLCLVHGVFFAADKKTWPGQPKVKRAVSAFVEAEGVQPAVSGGVKRDAVRHGIPEGAGGSKEGYGSIPFHRTEFTAASITAYFAVDVEQLRAYGLGAPAANLLEAIARWEIASLLDGGMRLRTACDLEPVEEVGSLVDRRTGEPLGDVDELAARVTQLVGDCRDLFGPGGAIEVAWDEKGARG